MLKVMWKECMELVVISSRCCCRNPLHWIRSITTSPLPE